MNCSSENSTKSTSDADRGRHLAGCRVLIWWKDGWSARWMGGWSGVWVVDLLPLLPKLTGEPFSIQNAWGFPEEAFHTFGLA